MSQILPKLYLGSWEDANNLPLLFNIGVTHVVNISKLPNVFPRYFTYMKIDINDDPAEDISRYFDPTANFIHDAITKGGTVFVHCYAGISRSPTIVISYIVQKLGARLEDTYRHVKSRRNIVNPNQGFAYQLYKRYVLDMGRR